MGAMGYDAVTVGNHEFDYTGPGFGEMLTAAAGAERRPRPCCWPTTGLRRTARTGWTSSGPWPHTVWRSPCFWSGAA